MIQTTEQELQAIVAQLKPYIMEYIRQYSVGVGEIELATTLEGVYSLPALMCIGGVDKIVEVPVELLQVAVSNVVDECVAATQSANTAAQAATDAGNSASAVIADLEELKTSITQAISESATAIQGANTAKDNANTAAAAANEAADKANKAAEGVSESISAANTAAQGANTAKENAETAAKAAVEAAGKVDSSITASRNLPKIQNGTWWVYDIESETYVDSGNPATGRSPKIQDGTWWVWNDETSQYANTGVSVNSAYELTKEKVENVLTGNITSHTHSYLSDAPSDGQIYGRKNGTWAAITSGTGGSVDISEILNRIGQIGEIGGNCTDEDYNLLKGYADNGVLTYINTNGTSQIVDVKNFSGNIQIVYSVESDSGSDVMIISVSSAKQVTISQKTIGSGILGAYTKPASYASISPDDSISEAIGKLEAGISTGGDSSDDIYYLPTAVLTLDSQATKEEIVAAFGGSSKRTELINAIKAGKKIYIQGNETYTSTPVYVYNFINTTAYISFIRKKIYTRLILLILHSPLILLYLL